MSNTRGPDIFEVCDAQADEIDDLKRRLSEAHDALRRCVDGLKNGGKIGKECTHEFHLLAANEVMLFSAKQVAEITALKRQLAETLKNAALSGASSDARWPLGMMVHKTKGASWRGRIVGYYSTDLTPEGYCVESAHEPGSVQIYPRAALALAGKE